MRFPGKLIHDGGDLFGHITVFPLGIHAFQNVKFDSVS